MKRLWGIDITGSFVFTPGAAGVGTLQFVGQTLSLEQLLVVTNVTRNEALYNFLDPVSGSAGFTGNVLTLDANTSTHSASDKIQAWVYVNGAQDVSTGELMQTLSALRMAIQSLTRNMGRVDTTGRLIVAAEQPTASSLNTTISGNVGTVTSVTTVTNQAQHGGIAANDFIPITSRLGGDNLRRNISVT
jgi:hypothetical protein